MGQRLHQPAHAAIDRRDDSIAGLLQVELDEFYRFRLIIHYENTLLHNREHGRSRFVTQF